METINYKIEKLAFEGPKVPYLGHTLKASYLSEPKGQALIEIFNEGVLVKRFLFPDYKIYNIAAHFNDIVDGLVNASDSGIAMAASDGLGGHSSVKEV